MESDSLFDSFFRDAPEALFKVLGEDPKQARRYRVDVLELKATSFRIDGVFLPLDPSAGPAYLVEAQFYRKELLYAEILGKLSRCLIKTEGKQEFIVVVIYPSRSFEQHDLRTCRCLIDSDQLRRIYLDELPPAGPDDFDMGVLELIAAKPKVALAKARQMIPRVRRARLGPKAQRKLLQFIETVIVHQFPKLPREEIEKMLQVTDMRQTRVYQEGKEEGKTEEREVIAVKLLKKRLTVTEIAEITGLTPAEIRKLK